MTQKSFELLRQRERLLEDVRIFRATPPPVIQSPKSDFDRTQEDLRAKRGIDAAERLARVEDQLRGMGVEMGDAR